MEVGHRSLESAGAQSETGVPTAGGPHTRADLEGVDEISQGNGIDTGNDPQDITGSGTIVESEIAGGS